MRCFILTWSSQSEEETYQLGKWIGENSKPGDLILLYGDLGSGKTILSRGIAHGAGFNGYVTSPTFTLMNIYKGDFPIYHFDIYRLYEPEELYDLDYEEYFYGDGVAIIEWSERLGHLLPSDYLQITLSRVQEENNREIDIKLLGDKFAHWKEVLEKHEGFSN
ncbi:MAG: tRNA (adenosine(37)-N6)-threonylcarbamoyltransferase complex ATPase subunit type 1 TsaE [Clostridiales bacterium]|nr:tRNA (adenosine(37)-N6)-threonylcarbamoyltransferase complex ATPase subunit type 1 TsaE [Clostridiales bacterium]